MRRNLEFKEESFFTKYKKILTVTAVILLILAAAGLFLIFRYQREKNQGGKDSIETERSTETESSSEAGQTESEEERQHSETFFIAAEVAPLDDKEDPQKQEMADVQEGTGERINVSEWLKAEQSFENSGITHGIDVSKWQGQIDWKKVKDAGIEFAMIRVGYRTQKTGVIYEDPYAKYNLQEARDAGIKIGVYFFSTAVTKEEALEEAAWVSGLIARYPVTYPVVYNCEGYRETDSRMYGLSKEQRSELASVFLDYIRDRGYTPMLYAGKSELEGERDWNTASLTGKYKIWVAQYPEKAYPKTEKSAYNGTHAMWQYTSEGQVDGISTAVDVNIAYFGYDTIAEPKDSTPAEEVEMKQQTGIQFTDVNETVTAKILTNLRRVPSTAKDEYIVDSIAYGQTVIRTGISSYGWSRVEYEGQTLYAVSSYLTTDLTSGPQTEPDNQPSETAGQTGPEAGITFEEVSETVTAKEVTNLRRVPNAGSDADIVASITNGQTVIRTGIGSNGWSRIVYEGQTLYAVTSYLTTDMNYTPVTGGGENPGTSSDTVVYETVNEMVTAKEETNLRRVASAKNDEDIVVKIVNGEQVLRTGIGSNGWSRLEYNGQVVYAITSYLEVAAE